MVRITEMYRTYILIVTLLFGVILVDGTTQFRSRVFEISNNGLSVDEDVDWWKTALFYEIYPRSFKDSNNDGIGDLRGVIQKLNYLAEFGVDAIWLNPIFTSPQVDNGYDISDYRNIDAIHGTSDDLRQLLDEAHKLNIKVLLAVVPNHTSDKHEWFQASLKNDTKYGNYYVWSNGTDVDGERTPPNNWLSFYSDSAWEWNEGRQEYYLHQFSVSQPDLNYRNPEVVEEMKDILRYWLNFGVDGFIMSAVSPLFEDIELRDEMVSGNDVDSNDHDYLLHFYTIDQSENFDMIYQWREVLDKFNEQNNTYTRIMITEGSADIYNLENYYGTQDGSRLGAHVNFNFVTFVARLEQNYAAFDLIYNLQLWFHAIPNRYANNWMLGNHDIMRVSTRLGEENIDPFNMLTSILLGTQTIYQGQEIGQENGEVTCEEGTDPRGIKNCDTFNTTSRDFERTPFQWDDSTNAGFNDGAKTWLPVSEKYVETNLAKQNVPDISSHYNLFKQLLTIRKEFKNTTTDRIMYGVATNLFFAQRITDNVNYALLFNTAELEEEIDNPFCSDCMTVAAASLNSAYKMGDKFNESQPLKPKEAVLNIVVET